VFDTFPRNGTRIQIGDRSNQRTVSCKIRARTMSDHQPAAYVQYVESWRRRLRAENEALDRRRAEAMEAARRVADLLKHEYAVRRVILFGSLAWGGFREDSDIDLAVEGIEKARYFTALVDAGRLTDIPVELKPLEECQGLIRERILKAGVVLHEA